MVSYHPQKSSDGILYKEVGNAVILHLARKAVRFGGHGTPEAPSQRSSILLFSRQRPQNNSDYPFPVLRSGTRTVSWIYTVEGIHTYV